MGVRVGLVILFILGTSWSGNSRELQTSDILARATDQISLSSGLVAAVFQGNNLATENDKETDKKGDVCTLCEEYTADALTYLNANKTQTEIMDILYFSCSKLHFLKKKCLVMVDHYIPLFFVEISSIEPRDFCREINLCKQVALISQHISKNSCEFCHYTIAEALMKLKDPDTELDIIEVLLKACQAVKGYEKKCKRMVLEYGPMILQNAEHLLESNDICTILRACNSPKANAQRVQLVLEQLDIFRQSMDWVGRFLQGEMSIAMESFY
ncbi:Proactivator polypeptide [Heracleum sosnowskyi]|uniref:Pulmonary surfactant-associated protein B n=1 Tax=Heracleum sosnowskyi TaxID=360622 RepID=A0AAD8J6K3_9APIA|nr:Proactivator polypeptide [Heracleum sosnowskyi]